jgi:tetratricopeptide (TPR) repeat protein
MAAAHLVSVLKLLSSKSYWQQTLIGARALSARSKDPAYIQISASYEGRALEELSRFDEAVTAYRKALSVKAHTEEGAAASLALGILEFRKGEFVEAEKTLADSIARNSGAEGTASRAKAYRVLADIARSQGDSLKAKGYETVLKELFGMEL